MAVAALLLWLCTAAIGSYLLVTAIHAGNTGPGPEESAPVPAGQPAAARTAPAAAGSTATAGPAAPASPLVLTLHAIGATLTLLFAVLIAVRA